jgi:hypothetical protein
LTPDDLSPFADIELMKATAMIDDALALAARVAPCITEETFEHADAAKAILRGAILRWNESGTGALTQQGAGPFQVTYDNRTPRRALFQPSEISQLQELCRDGDPLGQAFTVDTTPAASRDGYWSTPDTWVPL